MNTNYEFHWSKTHYFRSVVNADSLAEAIEKQRSLFESNDWDSYVDDYEVTYYQLEWVDERRATAAEQEYFEQNLNRENEQCTD